MDIPEYIDRQIDKMEEGEKKEVWEQLKNRNDVYVVIPTNDSLNYRHDTLTSYIRMKTLPSLKYASGYYYHVRDIYKKYDFILNKDFFETFIHPNEYDAIYVTEKTRENANNICERIDERIDELEKKN